MGVTVLILTTVDTCYGGLRLGPASASSRRHVRCPKAGDYAPSALKVTAGKLAAARPLASSRRPRGVTCVPLTGGSRATLRRSIDLLIGASHGRLTRER